MLELDSSFSRLTIENAFIFTDRYVSLSDLSHGVYCMFFPERLYTPRKGCTQYVFKTFVKFISSTKDLLDSIKKLHFTIHHGWRRNSERDFPLSAGRNSLFAKSKQNGTEQRGNLLQLLCLSHTDTICNKLKDCLSNHSISINKFF